MKRLKMLFIAVLIFVVCVAVSGLFSGCSDEKNPINSDLLHDQNLEEGKLPGIPPDSYPDAPAIHMLDSALQEQVENTFKVMGVSEATIMNQTCTWLGVKYLYGGNSRSGVDCSHLVYQAYQSSGISYPYMTTSTMRTSSRFICVNPLPGDIILFMNINHCGIYAGNGWMIDANSYYRKVRYDYIWDSYWSAQRPVAIRFIG